MGAIKDYSPSPGHVLVSQLLDYCPETGVFRWRVRAGPRAAGSVAGFLEESGYIGLGIQGKTYKAHRVAWLLAYGVWPEGQIDHIDGDRANNALSNLRLATVNQNAWNQRRAKCNTSGYKGVYLHVQSGKWRAVIGAHGRRHSLGLFTSVLDAAAAYAAASNDLHKDFSKVN